ncbi:MAG TPA: alpha/beta hydrolase [Gemmatimonadaceae bacterium]|nr:alpha/beta hydrolase [Gemmatimonadaceae bacterium]
MTIALIIVAVIAIAYGGILFLLWRMQERIVFQPPPNPEPFGGDVRRLEYVSRDGIRLAAYVVEPDRPGGDIVLAFHGNAMIARWMIPWAREVAGRFGVRVVLPEYRGYDGLAGVPTYQGAALDAEAALAATCRQFGVSAADVIYYGHSLGTAIAGELATLAEPRALILESPLSSAKDMAARWPVAGLRLFWSRISRVHYDTVTRVSGIDSVVHVAHGERDIIIPSRMGQTVHAAARRPGTLLMVPEAGHNDVAVVGSEAYWRWFGEALHGRSR